MLSDGIRLPPGKATSIVAFAFMLLEDGFLVGFKKNPTHWLPWPELKQHRVIRFKLEQMLRSFYDTDA
jgi:hypothetical protein